MRSASRSANDRRLRSEAPARAGGPGDARNEHWTLPPPDAREEVVCDVLPRISSGMGSLRPRIIRMACRSAHRRTILLLGTAFLAGAAIGPAAGRIARHLGLALGVNAAFAQDSDRADTYRLLALFGDAFERVRSDYVDPVSDQDLVAERDQRHADRPRSAFHLPERRRVSRDAGGDRGQIRRTWHRGHPGQRSDQGDQHDGRHAGVQGRDQGRRCHHRAERQVGAVDVPEGCGRSHARGTQFEGHADDQASRRR